MVQSAPLEVPRLMIIDGVMDLRFCGARQRAVLCDRRASPSVCMPSR
jgi:hypothetical protein